MLKQYSEIDHLNYQEKIQENLLEKMEFLKNQNNLNIQSSIKINNQILFKLDIQTTKILQNFNQNTQITSDSKSINFAKQTQQTQNIIFQNKKQCLSNLQELKSLQRTIIKNNNIKIQCKTQFPLVRSVALNQFGWNQLSRQDHKQLVDIIWQDGYVTQQLVNRLRPYQRINHFPYSSQMGRKDYLFMNLNKMKNQFPEFYNFYPKTWIYPEDFEKFKKQTENQEKQNKDIFYIAKPVSSCQGKGIYLTKRNDLIQYFNQEHKLLVQQYMDSPLLIDGLKFDLRIYVLIKSLHPLNIYVYNQGLTRLATNAYQKPDKNNYKNGRMHLTNYAINKNNPDFIQNKDFRKDYIGHKRSLNSFYHEIQKMGANPKKVKQKINNIIIKSILAAYEKLNGTQKLPKFIKDIISKSNNVTNNEQKIIDQQINQLKDIKLNAQTKIQIDHKKNNNKCFQLLGFDIMIQKDFEPKLIEINHQPSLQTGSPLDFIIKKYLLIDLFNVLNLKSEEKEKYLSFKRQVESKKANKRQFQMKEILSKKKQQAGNVQIGGFLSIYPSLNEQSMKIYKKIIPELAQQNKNKNKRKNYLSFIKDPVKHQFVELEKHLLQKTVRTSLCNKRKQFSCNLINFSPQKCINYLQKKQQKKQNSQKINSNMIHSDPIYHESQKLQNTERNHRSKPKQFLIPKKNLNFTIKYKSNITSGRKEQSKEKNNFLVHSNLMNPQLKTLHQNQSFYHNKISLPHKLMVNQIHNEIIIAQNPYLQPYLRNFSQQTQRKCSSLIEQKNKQIQLLFVEQKNKANKTKQLQQIKPKTFNPDDINHKKISFQRQNVLILNQTQRKNQSYQSVKTNSHKNSSSNSQSNNPIIQTGIKNNYLDHLCQKQVFNRFEKIKSMKQKIQKLRLNRPSRNKYSQYKQIVVEALKIQKMQKDKQKDQQIITCNIEKQRLSQSKLYIKTLQMQNQKKIVNNLNSMLNRSIQMFRDQSLTKNIHTKR